MFITLTKTQFNNQNSIFFFKNEIYNRKKLIQKYDAERKKNEKLDEIDELAKEEAEYLLKKANEQRQEQEDEIKRLNEVSLSNLF